MRQYAITVGPLAAADDDGIAQSQTPLAAGSLTLNGVLVTGGVAVLDVPRRVILTFAADETGHSFVITGTSTNYGNATISETLAGTTAGVVQSVLDYKTVTSITISTAATGAIKAGTNGVASSPPLPLDIYARSTIALQASVSGTVNYTVSQTLDSPWDVANTAWVWVNHPDTNLVASSSTVQGNYAYPPSMTRLTINSGTGSVKFTVNQPGIIG